MMAIPEPEPEPEPMAWETYIDDDPDRLRHWLAALVIELSAARRAVDDRSVALTEQIDVVLSEIDRLDRRIDSNRLN
jgi:hypothetical protein